MTTPRVSPAARIIQANGIELCIEPFGDPADPTILLIHGAGASMLGWDETLCEQIAAAGRHVVRYDNRDTGLSTSWPPGRPDYTLRDMAADAIGILDGLGVERAHIVGRSMAGAIALILGVDYPDRVSSLTFVGTTPGDDDLPPMSPAFLAATEDDVDPSDREAVIDSIVRLLRAYAGPAGGFDEPAVRERVAFDVARTRNVGSALSNHFRIGIDGPHRGGFADIRAPTLVVHGDQDPVFPAAHGVALARRIPRARLLLLQETGHELPPRSWPVFVRALVEHTATATAGDDERGPSRES